MNQGRHADMREQVAAVVRSNVPSAMIAALSLALFGFVIKFVIPVVTDMFTLGDAIFGYTMRIGGVAMFLAAAACLTGRPAALVFDAVMSFLIGIGLIVSSVLMISGAGGAGINQILYLIFGGMFVSVGVRNGRLYGSLTAGLATLPPTNASPAWTDVPAAPPVQGGAPSLAERLRDARRGAEDPSPVDETTSRPRAIEPKPGPAPTDGAQAAGRPKAEPIGGSLSAVPDQRIAPAEVAPAKRQTESDEPPTEGFLASFAKKPPARE